MQAAEIDWLKLWRELIIANPHTPDSRPINKHKKYAYQSRSRPDPLLEYIIQSIDFKTTVIDIGAGNGRWAVPVSMKVKKVTAIEPDTDMVKVLSENIKNARGNIKIVQSSWEQARVEIHDVAICAHAMYSVPDFVSFINKMEQMARKACYLAIRLPPVDGVIGKLAKIIYGHPYDSANAVIAYNTLYSMGIYANIMVENDINHWVNDTFEEAFTRAKRHLHLEMDNRYDELIRDTLRERLTISDNLYVWPDGMRSALLWWNLRLPPKSGHVT